MKRLLLLFALIAPATAQAQSAHSVTLNWAASPDAAANPTLSYNVYRATAACSTSPTFLKIDSTTAGVLTFTDTAISVGQTLCYELTSVLNGVEGGPSGTVQVVILPSPPASVTATVK